MKKSELINYKIKNNINFLRLNYFLYQTESNYDFVKKIIYKQYKNNSLCQQIITLNYKNIINLKFYYEQKYFKDTNVLSFERQSLEKYINFKDNKENLIITNLLEINYQLQDKFKFESQLFQHEEMTKESYDIGLKKLKNPFKYYTEDKIKDMIKDCNKKKYDNILLKLNEFLFEKYYHYFLLTKIPNILLLVTLALQQIKKGGNVYFFLRNGQLNNTLKKIFTLLVSRFNNYKVHSISNNLVYLLEFNDFKDNITEETLQKLRNICLKSRPYNYSLCQVLHYYYHLLKKDPKNAIGYELDLNEVGISKQFKSNQASIQILDDIDIEPEITKDGELLVYQLEKMFEEYDNTTRYNILKYVHYKDPNDYQTMYVDKDFIDKIYYENTIQLVKYFEENKIPYNKTYLAYIDKYNTNLFNRLYSIDNNIHMRLIKYSNDLDNFGNKTKKKSNNKNKSNNKTNKNTNSKNPLFKKFNQQSACSYSELQELQSLSFIGYKVKENLLSEISGKKVPMMVKKATEDFARGVSQYLNANYELRYPVSNAFIKLWEIYTAVPNIVPNKNTVKALHFAEAPGNWINCTSNFIATKKPKVENYHWNANSLSAKHPKNLEKFGKGIFSDDYGFMKKYPERWLFGKDGTGDITTTKNLRWFRDYCKEWTKNGKIDFVTGDGGIVGNLVKLQSLEFAQMCMAVGCLSKGGNCVVKHFLPYVQDIPESEDANGFFINLIYIYNLFFKEIRLIKPHSSSPNSGEFYIVGLKFKGITDDEFEKLISPLNNFKANNCFFSKSDIPETFSNQVVEFMEKLLKMNTEHYDIMNTLLTCVIDKDPVIQEKTQCNKFLNSTFLKQLHKIRFEEWIKMNKFEA